MKLRNLVLFGTIIELTKEQGIQVNYIKGEFIQFNIELPV